MKKEVLLELFFTLKKHKLSLFLIFVLSSMTFFLLMKFLDKNSDDYLIKLETSIINHGYTNPFYSGIDDFIYIQLSDLENFISFDKEKLEIFFKIPSIEYANNLNSKVEVIINEYMETVYKDANSIIKSYSKFSDQNLNSNSAVFIFDAIRLFEDYENEFKLYKIDKNESKVIIRKFNSIENTIISIFISFCLITMYLFLLTYRRIFKN